MARQRLDLRLVAAGLVSSRARAQAAVSGGLVRVDGAVATKAAMLVRGDALLSVEAAPELAYVSRAALKLLHGLDHFEIEVADTVALDLGASTGGFTQVLLARGAARVFAVDVGHGQLDAAIAADPRVTAIEGLNARDVDAATVPVAPQLVVCDVSFISLKLALPASLALAAPRAELLALIKPQFEVGRQGLGKGGIVRDPALQEQACTDIATFLEAEMGWAVQGVTPSPITGGDGNQEYLIAARGPR
ncbi:23S rRNA (cytidine1920-2'-O)/16S rRNA (cytidine1409-2'-O)-methyltransferase [Rhodoligotrophos appendicifer]|uniref:TlyA family RNA methyltransferase n=1 Tax=Rhodoligotrophos appendicifer TaxID=987056 RepID=UPI001185D892|nr:TlyA family RNA methyltransferase [Rhodoligotrophos appendicifer]